MSTGLVSSVLLFFILGLIPKKYRSSSTPWIGIAFVLVVLAATVNALSDGEHEAVVYNVTGWVFSIYMALDLLTPIIKSNIRPTSKQTFKVQPTSIKSYSDKVNDTDDMDGLDFENWCANMLRSNGFSNVTTTPGSGDQGVDITAVKDGERYAFQCKRYQSKLGNKPVQEVNTGKVIYGCTKAVVITNNYFTPGAIEAANAVGVELWDRDKIALMVDRPYKRGRNPQSQIRY